MLARLEKEFVQLKVIRNHQSKDGLIKISVETFKSTNTASECCDENKGLPIVRRT